MTLLTYKPHSPKKGLRFINQFHSQPYKKLVPHLSLPWPEPPCCRPPCRSPPVHKGTLSADPQPTRRQWWISFRTFEKFAFKEMSWYHPNKLIAWTIFIGNYDIQKTRTFPLSGRHSGSPANIQELRSFCSIPHICLFLLFSQRLWAPRISLKNGMVAGNSCNEANLILSSCHFYLLLTWIWIHGNLLDS